MGTRLREMTQHTRLCVASRMSLTPAEPQTALAEDKLQVRA